MGSCLSGDDSRGGDARGGLSDNDNERGRQQDQRSDESTVRLRGVLPVAIHLYFYVACWRGKKGRLIYASAVAVQLPAIFQQHAYWMCMCGVPAEYCDGSACHFHISSPPRVYCQGACVVPATASGEALIWSPPVAPNQLLLLTVRNTYVQLTKPWVLYPQNDGHERA